MNPICHDQYRKKEKKKRKLIEETEKQYFLQAECRQKRIRWSGFLLCGGTGAISSEISISDKIASSTNSHYGPTFIGRHPIIESLSQRQRREQKIWKDWKIDSQFAKRKKLKMIIGPCKEFLAILLSFLSHGETERN